MFKILFFTLSLMLFSYADTLRLDPQMKGVATSSNISFFEDTTKKMNIKEIMTQNFKRGTPFRTNKGASRSDWWIRLHVQNPTDKAIEWVLKFNYRQFDTMESWQFDDTGLLLAHSIKGDHYLNVSKTSFSQRNTFDFITSSKAKNTIYIKLSYADAGVMEMFNSVWSKKEFISSQHFYIDLLVGIMSALGILLFYNIFIWFILRKKEYFWYNAYLIGVIFAILTFNQVGAIYLWGSSPYLIDMMPFISAVIMFISFMQFTRTFLETNKLLPTVDELLKVLILVNIIGIVLAHIGWRLLAIQMIQAISFTFMFFPLIGLVLWHRGYKIARGYTIASSVLSITVIISILRVSGIVETSEFLFWIGRFGFILEGVLLSIALADRITILEHNYKNEQEKVKHTLEEAKKALSSEVKKRTHELETQTKKAEKLARIDEMTGIWNRRAFLEHGERLITDTASYQAPFSLIIIDIDHFKKVNDSYGHEAGDLVLKIFSQEIKNNMRDTDFFARIGGEEFVILLPNTTSKQALKKADLLLEKINKMDIPYNGSVLRVTVSMGVAEFIHTDDNIYTLLSKADKALYSVKNSGRNGIRLYHSKISEEE
ncbi:diguanylate cyclase [Sulfurimonas sp. HSL-1716]|uniref:sensor domain-containing diguanylate cyclase n=1 Tax=Hydrocurvibacter sulfurireducens TaxID=3131937 RepID=UPI0031F84476